MTENGLFVLGGPETQLHEILWAVHDEKTMVEARARKISGTSRLRWLVGADLKMSFLETGLIAIVISKLGKRKTFFPIHTE